MQTVDLLGNLSLSENGSKQLQTARVEEAIRKD